MNVRLVLPWLCAAGVGIGLAAVYMTNQKQTAELTQLRADSQELQNLRAAAEETKTNQAQAENAELAKLREDNKDLLRLRNEVRQLRAEKDQLTKQLQTAQSQAQSAQAQAQNAQAQAQNAQAQAAALRTAAQAAQTLTAKQQAAFAARYGLPANATPEAKANACINNLRQIEGAKQQWALENNKTADAVPTAADIALYLKNKIVPTCPAGGIYTVNAVNAEPTCSIPGHAIPK